MEQLANVHIARQANGGRRNIPVNAPCIGGTLCDSLQWRGWWWRMNSFLEWKRKVAIKKGFIQVWVNVDFMAMCMRARNWASPWQSAVFHGALMCRFIQWSASVAFKNQISLLRSQSSPISSALLSLLQENSPVWLIFKGKLNRSPRNTMLVLV